MSTFDGITDAMASGSPSVGPEVLIGRTITAVHEVVDSDRQEFAIETADGSLFLMSCDPGYRDDYAMSRDPTRWEVCMYDATNSAAMDAVRRVD